MMRIEAVVALFPDLPEPEIADWIARGWLQPETVEGVWVFAAIDVARIGMLHDLRGRMALAPDDLTVILALLDQVYELRRTLRCVLEVVSTQPDEVRQAVLRAVGR